ncbi:hypothetical protein ACFL27_16820, partial [candidate division CSSED10-310 bacterium]
CKFHSVGQQIDNNSHQFLMIGISILLLNRKIPESGRMSSHHVFFWEEFLPEEDMMANFQFPTS